MLQSSLQATLFERLVGRYSDGSLLKDFDLSTQVLLSIRDSIAGILNCRRGTFAHLPDYGLPELSTIYCALPNSAHVLENLITQPLLCYEPRLKTIDIIQSPAAYPAVISYELKCELWDGGRAQFGSFFLSDGQVHLII